MRNDYPPVPPGSKLLKLDNGKLYFLVYSTERTYHEWIQAEWLVTLPGDEGDYWRHVIHSVAEIEWWLDASEHPDYTEHRAMRGIESWRTWAREGRK